MTVRFARVAQRRLLGFAAPLLAAALLAMGLMCAQAAVQPEPAFADVLHTAGITAASDDSENTVRSISAKEKKAYDRAVAACMDYANRPNPIVVDMSDLNLTKAQAQHVGVMLHSNGELFWVDTYNDNSFGIKQFSLRCYNDDATITAQRAQLDAAVKKALKSISSGMSQAKKVHRLHDYLIDSVTYTTSKKTAYMGLVEGKADCFGFTLTMDVLLRRSGFSTDVAFNDSIDHSWNLVKVDGKWYHVDVTWDANFTGVIIKYKDANDGKTKSSKYFDWRKEHCHLYLLQSDYTMNSPTIDPWTGVNIQSHEGWECHHKCTSYSYDSYSVCGAGGSFLKSCVRSFTVSGVKYSVTGIKRVENNKKVLLQVAVKGVTGKKQRKANALDIPKKVKYRSVNYYVTGIARSALAKTKARTLRVCTGSLSASRVKGCLTGSKVKRVQLPKALKSKKAAYRKCFKKSNSGRSVKIVVK